MRFFDISYNKTHNGYLSQAENYAFASKERDTETGLSYFGARYYSSDLSIWLSVDPMVDKYLSLSPYVYCANNPIKLVDPNGEEVSNPDDPPKRNLIQNIGDGFVKFDKSLEGHNDGANQASDVPECVKNGVQAIVSTVPGISEINDAKTVVTKKDIYGNEASKTDVTIAKASLVIGGGLSVAKKGIVAIAKNTTSLATKTKVVAAAKVTTVSKVVTEIASKGYTSLKLLFNPSKDNEKKTSNKR